MIRPAETRDLPTVITLFQELLGNMQKSGVDTFAYDEPNQYIGGLMKYVVAKSTAPGHVVLVREDEGKVEGMLIGSIQEYPEFHRHRKTALLEYVYPLTFSSTPIAQEFYKWAKKNGATVITCIVQLIQDRFLSLYERQGFNAKQVIMTRDL